VYIGIKISWVFFQQKKINHVFLTTTYNLIFEKLFKLYFAEAQLSPQLAMILV